MIIAQISDTHLALGLPDADRRLADFSSTVDHINALERQPDVIVHTGDITHNGTIQEYQKASAILAKARAPVFVLAGNKDKRANLRKTFHRNGLVRGNSNFIEYSVEDFPVKLVMLDTLSLTSNKGDFCAKRLAGFAGLIADNGKKPTIIFSHHPPFDANRCPDPIQFETEQAMADLRRAIGKADNILAVICGHVHRFDWGDIGTIPAFAMPSTATSLRWGDYPPAMKNKPVYQRFEIGHAGALTVQCCIVD